MAAQQLSHASTAAGVSPSAPREDVDLDTRISRVEQQLIAREQGLLGQVRSLRQRASAAAAPRALLLGAAGTVLAGASLMWAVRRGGRRRAGDSDHVSAAQVSGPSQLMLSLLPMAWPLLPARWRTRVSPATAATALGLAASLVERLFAKRYTCAGEGHRSAPATVAHLHL